MYSKMYVYTYIKKDYNFIIFESLSNSKKLMACAFLKGIMFNKSFYLDVFQIINLFFTTSNFEKNIPRNSVSF